MTKRPKKTKSGKKKPESISFIDEQLSDVDLRLLRIFIAVVECSGFTAAQQQLGILQSTVSTHMLELERRLGSRLCLRGRGGFTLTKNGETVYAAARELFSAVGDYRSKVSEIHGKIAGSIRIGVLNYTITDPNLRLSEAVKRIREVSNNVSLDISFNTSQRVLTDLKEKRLHIGIATAHHVTSGLLYQPLYEERAELFCSSAHPLSSRIDHGIDPADVLRFSYVARGYEEAELLPIKRLGLQPAALANNVEGVLNLILSGEYVGYLPTHYAESWVNAGFIRAVLSDSFSYSTTINLVLRREANDVPIIKVFIKHLKELYNISDHERKK